MKFGPVPVEEAEGALAAHTVRLTKGAIRKGTRITAAHVASLREAGIGSISVARLEPGDVHEDEAAGRLAEAVAGDGIRVEAPFTGRSNLYAEAAGVFEVDREAIDRLNRIDPAITIATLPAFATVEAGRMVGTVKIIPFAAPAAPLATAEALARKTPPLRLAPFRPLSVGLIATRLPSLKTSVMDKTRAVLDARLARAGASVAREVRVDHDMAAVGEALRAEKAAGRDLLLVFGASAVVDEHDVIPAGIEAAGGKVEHLGMPVDPGNLLILGDMDGVPVLGAPGCARSPAENGFDWVLDRILAGIKVRPEDITGMGVGGLLMEIVSRPQPREGDKAAQRQPKVAALILAAGRSSRMGGPNKLLATIGGLPLVRIVATAAQASRVDGVTVVTGHMEPAVRNALSGLEVGFAHNPSFAEGLSTSLRAGVEALEPTTDGVLILLADMPAVDAATIDRLITAFAADPDKAVVPTFNGRRGNPVIWPRRFFEALRGVSGDKGARELIDKHADSVTEVEVGPAVAMDLDTPDALAAAGGVFG